MLGRQSLSDNNSWYVNTWISRYREAVSYAVPRQLSPAQSSTSVEGDYAEIEPIIAYFSTVDIDGCLWLVSMRIAAALYQPKFQCISHSFRGEKYAVFWLIDARSKDTWREYWLRVDDFFSF